MLLSTSTTGFSSKWHISVQRKMMIWRGWYLLRWEGQDISHIWKVHKECIKPPTFNPVLMLFCVEFLQGEETFLCESSIFSILHFPWRPFSEVLMGLASAFLWGAGEVIDQGRVILGEMCWGVFSWLLGNMKWFGKWGTFDSITGGWVRMKKVTLEAKWEGAEALSFLQGKGNVGRRSPKKFLSQSIGLKRFCDPSPGETPIWKLYGRESISWDSVWFEGFWI